MESPYSAPESDVEAGMSLVSKRSIWWKIYFVFITILSFLGMASYLTAENSGLVDYLMFLIAIISTAGLFGFVFSKKVLFPKFWIPLLLISLVFGLFYEALSSVDMRQGMTDDMFYISMAIGYILSLPAYYGIYQYGNANKHPWVNG